MFLPNRIRNFVRLMLAIAVLAVAWYGLARDTGVASATTNKTIPLHITNRINRCTGEVVALDGGIHVVAEILSSSRMMLHLNYEQVTGVGQTTGDIYTLDAAETFDFDIPFPSTVLATTNFHLTSQGSGSNMFVVVVYRVTINAQGDATIAIDSIDIRCQ